MIADLLARLRQPQIGPVLAVQIIAFYTMLGALDEAYEFASRALDYAARFDTMGILLPWLWHPELLPFRKDARFSGLAARLRLADYWLLRGPPDGCTLRDGRLIVG